MEFLKESYKNRLRELSGIKKSLTESVAGKHLVVVDIQPEYESGFGDMHLQLIEFIETNWNDLSRVTFLYNGEDTLGMISHSEYFNWWWENNFNEEMLEQCDFYDKGYAFFRSCMDSGIDHDDITSLVREMIANDIHDSSDLDEDFWNGWIEKYGAEDVRDLIEVSGEAINIPDLMDELRGYGNIVLCGGGRDECLAEVEIALNALNKPYSKLEDFIYQENKKTF